MMTWQGMCAAIQAQGFKKDRAFRTFMRRTIKLAAYADPATGGNECMVRNWGNDEARRIWADGWQRWQAYSAECDRRYRQWWLEARAS